MKNNKFMFLIELLMLVIAAVGYVLWALEQSFTTVNILIVCVPMAAIGTLSAFIFGIYICNFVYTEDR